MVGQRMLEAKREESRTGNACVLSTISLRRVVLSCGQAVPDDFFTYLRAADGRATRVPRTGLGEVEREAERTRAGRACVVGCAGDKLTAVTTGAVAAATVGGGVG